MVSVAAGSSIDYKTALFAGAKEVATLGAVESKTNALNFDLMIDWGWFYFLTKPMFWAIDHLYGLVGNFGIAILLITVIVKAIFFPLASKSYASMAKMKLLQPKMEEVKKNFGDDKQAQQQAIMKLYQEEKVNPLAGCLPIAIQIPVFFSLYKVLYTNHRNASCAILWLDSGSFWSRSDQTCSPCSVLCLGIIRPSWPSVSGRSSWVLPCSFR